MYNSEIKEKYLDTLREKGKDHFAYTCKITFKWAQDSEELFGHDLALFSEEEIDHLYKTARSNGSASSMVSLNWRISKYVDYCIGIGNASNNNFKLFSRDRLQKYVRQVYYSPIEIKNFADQIVNSCDRFIIYAAYYGFSSDDYYKDITTLVKSSFNEVDNIITLWDGRQIKCPQDMIEAGLKSFDTYVYYRANNTTNKLEGRGILKPRVTDNSSNDEKVYRTLVTQRFGSVFRKQFKDSELTYQHVRSSGVVHFTNQVIFDEGCVNIYDLWANKRFQKDIIERFKIGSSITDFNGRFGKYLEFC